MTRPLSRDHLESCAIVHSLGDNALLRDYLESDRAMHALGDEVSLHPALYGVWHKPMPIAINEIARHAGVTISLEESAVDVFTRLTGALRVKRCQR